MKTNDDENENIGGFGVGKNVYAMQKEGRIIVSTLAYDSFGAGIMSPVPDSSGNGEGGHAEWHDSKTAGCYGTLTGFGMNHGFGSGSSMGDCNSIGQMYTEFDILLDIPPPIGIYVEEEE